MDLPLTGGCNKDRETHEELDDEQEGHQSDGAGFSKGIVINLSHWLPELGAKNAVKVWRHAGRDDDK